MSASKMRAAAQEGDYDSFEQGVPDRKHAKSLYKSVRKGMGLKEETLPTYMMEDILLEGVYDQGIFKAVFMMGGPGSGKSEVVNKLSLKALGLKLVNTDAAFESGLKKAGLSLDLRKIDANVRDGIRAKAKKLTGNAMDRYIIGRLGMIFDTTSAKKSKIEKYKNMLDGLGYEYKMIYVKTSHSNAQKRNQMRPRKLPAEIVTKDWEAAESNARQLKSLFGKDFYVIENDDTLAALGKKTDKLYSYLMGWTTQFPNNKLARQWKEQELVFKKTK